MSCFQRYCCRVNNHTLRTFVDAFQDHYKDGTEPGIRDCWWFAGIYDTVCNLWSCKIRYMLHSCWIHFYDYWNADHTLTAVDSIFITHYYPLLWQLVTFCYIIWWSGKQCSLDNQESGTNGIQAVILYAAYKCCWSEFGQGGTNYIRSLSSPPAWIFWFSQKFQIS